MERYIPDIYQKSIYTINYDALKKKGIKFLMFDLDNTIVSPYANKASNKTKELFDRLKNKGFEVVIFSNSHKTRVKPFGEALGVEVYDNAQKPFRENFLKVLKKHDIKPNEAAMIGDQLMTDIAGGNNAGLTTILVEPIDTKEKIYTKFNRFFERKKLKLLGRNSLFTKGKFYD